GGAPRPRTAPLAQVAVRTASAAHANASGPRNDAPRAAAQSVVTPAEPPKAADPEPEPAFAPEFDSYHERVPELPDPQSVEPPFEPPYVSAPAVPSREVPLSTRAPANLPVGPVDTGDWHGMVAQMRIGGLVRELAQHCELLAVESNLVRLRLPETHKHLASMQSTRDKLQEALSALLGREVRAAIETGELASQTPAQRNQIEKQKRHAEAVSALESDPFVREVIERFDATLIEASVKALP
ncbi:DNA polymerase III subunit gamma/tau, partial [Niveibacterium sp. 24ML]|uniref:DNA polymerase III subunit gamma/tau C-terminal domain-containing protein n=1 Tax=Niveibacterium sp. 24ML TaxID=2985512 RepID=UPI002272C6DC